MSVRWVTMRRPTAAHLSSCTDESGRRLLPPVPADGNSNGVVLNAEGTPSATINTRIDLLTATTLKASNDGGSNYFGRRALTTWDGNGATNRTVYTGDVKASNVCLVDSDGDGVEDKALCAIVLNNSTTAYIYSTTDLSGAGSWASATTITLPSGTGDYGGHSRLFTRGTELFLFYLQGMTTASSGMDIYALQLMRSVDNGTTWTYQSQIFGSADGYLAYGIFGMVLASGKLFVGVSQKTISTGFGNVYGWTSLDGITWTASAKAMMAGGSVYYTSPTVVQLSSGKIICFATQVSTGVVARQCTDVDPAASSATWGAYSETLWAANQYHLAQALIEQDDTVLVTLWETNANQIQYTRLKGSGTYPAVTAVITSGVSSGDIHQVANIGGAFWMTYKNGTTDIKLVCAQYWGAYNASTYPAANFMSGSRHFLWTGIWIETVGSTGAVGDYWTISSVADYGGHRMVCLTPGQPSRSVSDNISWSAVFVLPSNTHLGADHFCVMANVASLSVQMNDTDSWGSPSVNQTVSFVKQTFTPTSKSAGYVTYSSGTWGQDELTGMILRFATSDVAARIVGNSATRIYVDGTDMSSASGDATVLSTRAWVSFSAGVHKYLRLLIAAQNTPEGYYQVEALVAGEAITWGTNTLCYPRHKLKLSEVTGDDGRKHRMARGSVKRSFLMTIPKPTTTEYKALVGLLTAQDFAVTPFALIPDTTVATDWELVTAPDAATWTAQKQSLLLEGV